MAPKKILFGPQSSIHGAPLFKTQKELAEQIYLMFPGPKGFESPASLQSYLSLVLRGKKPMSHKLERALFSLLEERIPNKASLAELKENLLEALERIKTPEKTEVIFSQDENPNVSVRMAFEKMLRTPGHHVLITDNLIEVYNTPKANDVLEMIFCNIGVLPGAEIGDNKGFKYEYFVKDIYTSTSLWKNFYYYLREHKHFSHEKTQETLLRANRDAKIRIFHTKPYLASHNLYIHNIKRENPQAYRFYLHRENVCSVPPEALDDLLEHLYLPLKGTLKNNKGVVEEDKYGYPEKNN